MERVFNSHLSRSVRHFIFTSLRCLATKISSTWHTRTVDKQVLEGVFLALLIWLFFACRTSMKKSLEEKYPWLEQDIYTSYQSKVTFHFKLCQRDLL